MISKHFSGQRANLQLIREVTEKCADSSEPSLVADVISSEMYCIDPYIEVKRRL